MFDKQTHSIRRLLGLAAAIVLTAHGAAQAADAVAYYRLSRIVVQEGEKPNMTVQRSENGNAHVVICYDPDPKENKERYVADVQPQSGTAKAELRRRSKVDTPWYRVYAATWNWLPPPTTWYTGQVARVGGQVDIEVEDIRTLRQTETLRMTTFPVALLKQVETLPPELKTPLPTGSSKRVINATAERAKRASQKGYVKVKLVHATEKSWCFKVFLSGGRTTVKIDYHYEYAGKAVSPGPNASDNPESGSENPPGGGETGGPGGPGGGGPGGPGVGEPGGPGGGGTGGPGGGGTGGPGGGGLGGPGGGGTGGPGGGGPGGPGGGGPGGPGGGGTGPTGGPEVVIRDLPPGNEPVILAERRRVRQGDLVQIPVWLFRVPGLRALNVEMRYTAANVQVVPPVRPVRPFGDANVARFEANPNEAGIIRMGTATPRNLALPANQFAVITFRATGRPGTRVPLRLRVTTATNENRANVALREIDGEILITDASPPTALDASDALKMSVRLIPEDLRLDMDLDGRVTAEDAAIILEMVGARRDRR